MDFINFIMKYGYIKRLFLLSKNICRLSDNICRYTGKPLKNADNT